VREIQKTSFTFDTLNEEFEKHKLEKLKNLVYNINIKDKERKSKS